MKKRIIAVIGLGYVGLPVAIAFAKKGFEVIGFDINRQRIADLTSAYDKTCEVSKESLIESNIFFTDEESDLSRADFFIVTVPTPINIANQPDFSALISASEIIGRTMKKGAIVVYESTVYPGATEEICLPILQRESNLVYNQDFGIGYSPERINPADKINTFETIKKVVSGSSEEVLDIISNVYSSSVEAGIFRASSIKVAEAAKVIENTQRDVNIALINELSMLFHKMEIDTLKVLEAASTKWNFLPFKPGLVGGHCIGVDPYYLTYKAESVGFNPEMILCGRRTNNEIPKFIVYEIIKEIHKLGIKIDGLKVSILGLTFKENCPDIRNSKVFDIINELKSFNLDVQLFDPIADKKDVLDEYGVRPMDYDEITTADVIVFAVSHDMFKNNYKDIISSKLRHNGLIVDIKGIIDPNEIQGASIWRL